MRFLFLLFVILPIVEITLLIKVGDLLGLWNTVGLVLLSAFIGVNMLRYQGISTLARAQQRMQNGEMPGTEMVEGLILAVGGALLVTPGFVTDLIGFCCLIPYTRKAIAQAAAKQFTVVSAGQAGGAAFHHSSTIYESDASASAFREAKPSSSNHRPDVIDGEYVRKD